MSSWLPSWLKWGSDPKAKAEAAQKKIDEGTRELEAANSEMGATQQAEALSGPTPPPGMGGRRRRGAKKTRRAKKGKSRKARA